tara:strand:- start:5218 stop:6000 length:783 start_codon:yes stop_codon:yes gene_type:complete
MVFKLTERRVFGFSVLILIFMRLVFDPDLAITYLAIAFGAFAIAQSDKFLTLKIESVVNRAKSVMLGIAGYGVFLLVSTFILPLLPLLGISVGETSFSINSVIELYAQTQPLLAGNLTLIFLAFGLLIPILETWGIGLILEGLKDFFKIPLDIKNPRTYVAAGIIAALTVFFHIQVRGIDINATTALATVFIFFFINVLIIVIEKQILGAIIMHIIANTVAVSVNKGFPVLSLTSPTSIILIGSLVVFLTLNRLPKITRS